MRRTRFLVPLLLAGLFAAAVEPAAAASSVTERLIWDLNNNLIAIAVPITLLVEGILFYTVWKFRKADEAKPTLENRRLEVTWTIATALVLLFVGFSAYGVMANDNVITTKSAAQEAMEDDDTVVVDAMSRQWAWTFNYSEQNDAIPDQQEMVIPANETVVIRTKSTDVIHAFHAPGIGLKADSLPGQWNYMMTNVTEPGTYQLYCAEYCGQLHSKMLAKIRVLPEDEWQQWQSEQTGNASA